MKYLLLTVLVLALSPVAVIADTTKQPRRIELSITEKGFVPDRVTVTKGEPVILAFTRKTDKTCTKEVIVQLDDKQTVERKLPLNTKVEILVRFATTGELAYACGMDMNKGVIRVQ